MQPPVRGHGTARPVVPAAAAATVIGLSAAAAVAAVWLDAVTPPTRVGVVVLYGAPGSEVLPAALSLTACAAVVLWHDVRSRMGWLMALFALFWALDGAAESWVRFGVRADEALPGTELGFWFVDQLGTFLLIGVPLTFLLYPDGRFLRGAWGVAGRVSVGLMVAAGTVFVLSPVRAIEGRDRLPAGFDLELTAVPVDAELLRTLHTVLFAAAVASTLVAVGTVAVRYRRSREDDRDRLRWLVWGLLAELLLLLTVAVVGTPRIGDAALGLVVAVPAVAVTVGLVRPQLLAIDALLSSTLVYGALGVLVVGVDLVVLAGLGALLGDSLGQRQVVVVVLLLSALVYGPLREWLRGVARRLVLGRRDDRYDLVAGLASRLEQAADPDDQLAAVATAVATAFRVRFVSVEVDRGTGERLTATHGERPERVRSLPISYRGDVVGRLVLPATGLRARLTGRDEALLGDLVRQAATAARTGRLAEELQHSRERLVTAREEERRRIRRDLHDGLGPALSGVVFRVDAARVQLPEGPAGQAAAQALVEVREEVQHVITDVRRLVHDLRPPALDDLGLVGAVEALAATVAGGGLDVAVTAEGTLADGSGALPAAVDVAAYRIIGEAMTNTVRHAGATHCRVSLDADEERLVVEVVDDGRGIAPDAVGGVGLVSLRERAAELGGAAVVTCPPEGGTRVRAVLPVGVPG